jgi:site-specific DNA-adenine methylase
MRNHFFFEYPGSKRHEVKDVYEYFKRLQNINTIVEPYCGTCSISYYISTQEPYKYKYILNDNNILLMELYNTARDNKLFNDLINECITLMIDIDEDKYNRIINNGRLSGWIIYNKVCNVTPGIYPKPSQLTTYSTIGYFKNLRNCPIINFLRTENIIFSNTDAIDIYNAYSNNTNTFIFINPPYLTNFYPNNDDNIYEYLYNKDIQKRKAYILVC